MFNQQILNSVVLSQGVLMQNNFRKKVIDYIGSLDQQYKLVHGAELALGVIAVTDANEECDAYFDPALWRWTKANLWKEKPKLREIGLEVLEGTGRALKVHSIHDMATWAKEHLTPISDTLEWNDTPMYFC